MNKSKNIEGGKIVRVPFRHAYSYSISKTTNTATISELEIVPANLGARVSAIAPNFEYYRVTDLNVKQVTSPNAPVHYDSGILNVTLGVIAGLHAAAYEPSDATRTNVPTNLSGLANAPSFDYNNMHAGVQFRVPRKVLLGTPLKWWNTSSTGSPTETLVQGLMWHYSYNEEENSQANSPTITACLTGVIEFKGMILPTLSAASTLAEKRHLDDRPENYETRSHKDEREYISVLRPPETQRTRVAI